MRLTTADVRGLLGSPDVTLLDARAPAEYHGFEGNTKRLGHIPGALNMPVGATSEPGAQRLRDGAELRAMLHSANVTRGRRMVCYDGSGVAAAKLAFVLTLLGHEDVAVYDGGWADWGNRLDLPTSTSPSTSNRRSPGARRRAGAPRTAPSPSRRCRSRRRSCPGGAARSVGSAARSPTRGASSGR